MCVEAVETFAEEEDAAAEREIIVGESSPSVPSMSFAVAAARTAVASTVDASCAAAVLPSGIEVIMTVVELASPCAVTTLHRRNPRARNDNDGWVPSDD